MKIRVIKRLVDSVFEVRIQTEDWSELDRELMVKFGEPEINLGGSIPYATTAQAKAASAPSDTSVTYDDVYVRIMTESPFTRKFDSRDFGGSIDDAAAAAASWIFTIEARILEKVRYLRENDMFFTTEEITEY